MKEISIWINVGLSILGYLFIIFKSVDWISRFFAKEYLKQRKESRMQKAVNELYDAFELDAIKDGETLKVSTKGSLTIMMYRSEKK